LSFNGQGKLRVGSIQAGKQYLRQFLFGRPPKELGIIGETILDFALNAVIDTLVFDFKNKGAAGTAAHVNLEKRINAYQPIDNVRIQVKTEVFHDKDGKPAGRREKGSLGLDVVIYYKEKPVLAFDLKTGGGFSKKGLNARGRRFGTDIIQIFIKTVPK